jgi:hypothetical protein
MPSNKLWLFSIGTANMLVGAMVHSIFEIVIGALLIVCCYTMPEA